MGQTGDPLPVAVVCPSCRRSIDVPDADAAQVECPFCQASVRVDVTDMDRTIAEEVPDASDELDSPHIESTIDLTPPAGALADLDLDTTLAADPDGEAASLRDLTATVDFDSAARAAHPDEDTTIDFELPQHSGRGTGSGFDRTVAFESEPDLETPIQPADLGMTTDYDRQAGTVPAPATRPDADPSKFGQYAIHAKLGEGAFNTVYLAHDEELHRLVAIRVQNRDRISSRADADAYLAEARILACLDHPNIVPIYNLGRTKDGQCYVVSKYIDGTDLATRLKESRPRHVEAATIAASVAEALHHAHQRGVIHRDIKPSNILLDNENRPYLIDFGLAIDQAGTGQKKSTFTGTPAYMSPEQALPEGQTVDGRTDLYSLGVVFYELLTGRWPLQADTLGALRKQISIVEACPPSQLARTVPVELDRICLKALAKRPEERYQTAGEIAEDLRRWLMDNAAATLEPFSQEKKDTGEQATLQAVPVEMLPLCHDFYTPLRSLSGDLVLQPRRPISPRLFERCRRGNIATVWLHGADARQIGIVADDPAERSGNGRTVRLDAGHPAGKWIERALQKQGACRVLSAGPPLADKISHRGALAYDAKLAQEVATCQERDAATIQTLYKEIADGFETTGINTFNSIAQTHLKLMCEDLDLVLGSASRLSAERDYVARHGLELCLLGMGVAIEMGYDHRNVTLVGLTGLLHDVGLLKVPRRLRESAMGSLDPAEQREVMMHVVHSADILGRIRGIPTAIRLAAFQVHERHNGRGYPQGRAADEIHSVAKILGVVDAYLDLVSPPPTRNPVLPYKAMVFLFDRTRQGEFDSKVVRSLLRVLSLFPTGSHVILNDHRGARVVRANPEQYGRPMVEIVCDPEGKPLPSGQVIDLATDSGFEILQPVRGPIRPRA